MARDAAVRREGEHVHSGRVTPADEGGEPPCWAHLFEDLECAGDDDGRKPDAEPDA